MELYSSEINSEKIENLPFVCNVFFYDVEKRTSLADLKKYFDTFGTIIKIRFLNKKKNRKALLKSGYVNFAQSITATNVLKHLVHTLPTKQKFKVKASPQRYQPIEQYQNNSPENEDNNVIANNGGIEIVETSIMDLTDACLIHIWHHLTLESQIRFGLTCQRFFHIAQYEIIPLWHLYQLPPWILESLSLYFLSSISDYSDSCYNRQLSYSSDESSFSD